MAPGFSVAILPCSGDADERLDAYRWGPAKLVEEDGYPHRRFPLEHATFLLRCHLMRRGTASPGECYALVPNLRL